MTHKLNTNKQFMIGNGILAFAVIFVVVIFVYMSMRLDQNKNKFHRYSETYDITLTQGFVGDSISVLINDSLCASKRIETLPVTFHITRFAKESALMLVDNETEMVSVFELSSQGGLYEFEKDANGVKLLARKQ